MRRCELCDSPSFAHLHDMRPCSTVRLAHDRVPERSESVPKFAEQGVLSLGFRECDAQAPPGNARIESLEREDCADDSDRSRRRVR